MRFPLGMNYRIAKYIMAQNRAGNERYPLVLMLEPLHACNLACSGCGRLVEYRDTLSERLSLEECLEAAGDCGAPVVSVCGGEPLIHPEIDAIVREITSRKKFVYLCTNGWVLADWLRRNEPNPYLYINVHIDGMPLTHDRITGRDGSFEKALEGATLAKRLGYRVTTNTTVYRTTDAGELDHLFSLLTRRGVDGILVSPGYNYEGLDEHDFLAKEDIHRKFREISRLARKYRFHSTPLYLEFLRGERDYPCTPWGNVTYNPSGWKSPCYLITDGHYDSYGELLEKTDWERYRQRRDPRCRNCMMHSGFEPSVVVQLQESPRDVLKMVRWNLS